jgi:Xaa-Pro aminopeptidase
LLLDGVEPWSAFVSYIKARLAEGDRRLYVEESRWAESSGVPDDLRPVEGEKTLWRRSIEEAFPEASIESAASHIRAIRWVKSPAEIAKLREVASASAAAFLSGIRAIRPGIRQRDAELAVLGGCIEAGTEGPSFWPWTMSGPKAEAIQLALSVYDYHHHDQIMQDGDLVRVDIGCDANHYSGDVGRTVPVSGRFDAGQRETWDLLIGVFRAGLVAIRAGATKTDVLNAGLAEIERLKGSLKTDLARKAAQSLLAPDGLELFNIHSIGIEAGEAALERLEAGSVIAWEPMFTVDGQSFYLEDMILVTQSGHEVLTSGLPYTSAEIESAMARK